MAPSSSPSSVTRPPRIRIRHQLNNFQQDENESVVDNYERKSSGGVDKYYYEEEDLQQYRDSREMDRGILVSREDLAYTPPPPIYKSTYPRKGTPPPVDLLNQNQNGTSPHSPVIIRGEEVGIVLVVLILWVAAIILFFNRWGKIRMLEPYQPKFCEHHNPNCPMSDPIPPIPANYPRTFSKFNLSSELSGSPHFSKCNYHGVTTSVPFGEGSGLPNQGGGVGGGGGGSLGVPGSLNLLGGGNSPRLNSRNALNRPRQNSVFVTSPNYSGMNIFGGSSVLCNTSRKTKSAVDLSTLVLSGEFMDNVRRNSKNSITNL